MDDGVATPHRLYRSRQHRMVAGVAGGLGQYLGVDPVLLRLAFVALALADGIGLLLYIVMAVITPERPLGEAEPTALGTLDPARGRRIAGYGLVGVGALLLLGNAGLFRFWDWNRMWPLLLVGLGAFLLLRRA